MYARISSGKPRHLIRCKTCGTITECCVSIGVFTGVARYASVILASFFIIISFDLEATNFVCKNQKVVIL